MSRTRMRWWQMGVAGLSVALMIGVLLFYRHDSRQPRTESEPHVGAQHHTAEPHEGDKASPLQPFSTAKAGDWLAFETLTKIGDSAPKRTTTILSVESATDQTVTLVRSERNSSVEPPTVTRDERPRQGLTIDQLVGNRAAEWTLQGFTVTDESHEVGGRSFAAKKLAFSLSSAIGGEKRARAEMWLSPDVPLDGMVETRQLFEGMSFEVTHRLLGFGTASAITWGSKPDGL